MLFPSSSTSLRIFTFSSAVYLFLLPTFPSRAFVYHLISFGLKRQVLRGRDTWLLLSASGNEYTLIDDDDESITDPITIRLISDRLEISGDGDGDGTEDDWDGTWKKQ